MPCVYIITSRMHANLRIVIGRETCPNVNSSVKIGWVVDLLDSLEAAAAGCLDLI